MEDVPQSTDGEVEDVKPDEISSSRPLVSDGFDRAKHVFSTRTSEAYEGVDRKEGDAVLIWNLRFPLNVPSEEAELFVRRLSKIVALPVQLPSIRGYGVDSGGVGYVIYEGKGFKNLLADEVSGFERIRRFVEVLKLVEPLHAAGLALGDISTDSFVTDSTGAVLLGGILGAFERGAKRTALLPPPETLQFVAPEQRSGSEAHVTSDVYALGVYAYRLLTGKPLLPEKAGQELPDDVTQQTRAPSALNAELPTWVDNILGKCLEKNPEHRYPDVSTLLSDMEQAVRTGMPPKHSSNWARRTLIVRPSYLGSIKQEQSSEVAASVHPKTSRDSGTSRLKDHSAIEPGAKTQVITLFAWLGAVVLGIVGAVAIFVSLDAFDGGSDETINASLETQAEIAPAELKPLILALADRERSTSERIQSLMQLSESQDPTVYGVLVTVFRTESDTTLRQKAAELMVDRTRQQELPRTSDVMHSWFSRLQHLGPKAAETEAFTQLLRACDRLRTMEARKEALQKAFKEEPEVALQLAASLSLDESVNDFLPILRRFLSAELKSGDISQRGLGALLLSHPALSMFIDRNVMTDPKKFSDEDLVWALLLFAENEASQLNPALLYGLSGELLQRKLLSPVHTVFLSVLNDPRQGSLQRPVQLALVRAAVGNLGDADLKTLGQWTSESAEKVFLAICASSKDPNIALKAFDILSVNSLRAEPAASLVAWVKLKFWVHRKEMVRGIGILGLLDLASPEEVELAFEQLMPFSQGGLFRTLVQTKVPRLGIEALDRLGPITPSMEVVPLLKSGDPDLRIAAVRALQGRNDLGVLQGVLRAYESEKDERVLAVYQEVHWVTRNRQVPSTITPKP